MTDTSPRHREGDFVGRDREHRLLDESVSSAIAGRGSVWLISGEPGIGKSRLVEELATTASRRGVAVHWGRCWESGGAPAYWPWIQVLRTVLRDSRVEDPSTTVAPGAFHLAQLLPELSATAGDHRSPGPLDSEQARFQLMDSIVALFRSAVESTPHLVLLEDLHAADPTTLLLLDFLARQIRPLGLMVVGTYREAEVMSGAIGPLLRRVGRDAREIRLRPLTRDQVAEYLERSTDRLPASTMSPLLWQTTEGNPLYLKEIVSLLLARGSFEDTPSLSSLVIPDSVRAAILERAAALPASTLEVLDVASVLGREFLVGQLAELAGLESSEIEAELEEAVTFGLVERVKPGLLRFAHILTREVFHSGLTPQRRRSLHLKWANRLDRTHSPTDPRWSELAHHLAEAGPEARERAISASISAAEQATALLAFDDAAELYSSALAALEELPTIDPRRLCELLLLLAGSQLRAGAVAPGRQNCRRAADIARTIPDGELVARAALEYGSVFVYAEVDSSLVALLEEAQDALGDEQGGLRARVLARLAAAMQPAADPQQPIELARQAIEMARQVGEPETLLDAIRSGCSAMMDLADPSERMALNQEHVALAERLNAPIEAFRGHMRTVIDAVELGRLAVADGAIEACRRIAEQSSLPHHLWQVASFDAMRATMAGRFDQAEQLLDDALNVSVRFQDPNVERTLLIQRFGLLRAAERHDQLLELRPKLERAFDGIPQGTVFVTSSVGSILARLEPSNPEWPGFDRSTLDATLCLGDTCTLCHLAEMAAARGLREEMTRLAERLKTKQGQFAHWGLLGLVWEGPISRYLALLADSLGDHEEADRLFAAAFEQSKTQGAGPMTARTAYEHARSLLRRSGDVNTARASAMLDECLRTAESLQLTRLNELALALQAEVRASAEATSTGTATSAGVPAVERFRLRRTGEFWTCECADLVFQLKDIKGVRMLAKLVENPGREFHVLDLSGEVPGEVVDIGDSGEVLDDTARTQYRRRVEALRAEIEEAETWNDPERASRAREELDRIAGELSRAFGLGGRERRSQAASERARVNVQRRIKDAVQRIAEQCPEAGRHLEWAVRTGTFCSYDPS